MWNLISGIWVFHKCSYDDINSSHSRLYWRPEHSPLVAHDKHPQKLDFFDNSHIKKFLFSDGINGGQKIWLVLKSKPNCLFVFILLLCSPLSFKLCLLATMQLNLLLHNSNDQNVKLDSLCVNTKLLFNYTMGSDKAVFKHCWSNLHHYFLDWWSSHLDWIVGPFAKLSTWTSYSRHLCSWLQIHQGTACADQAQCNNQ